MLALFQSRTARAVLAVACIVAAGAIARAENPASGSAKGGPAQMSQAEKDMMALAAPGEFHKKLDAFVGNWKTTVKMWMGPGEPTSSAGSCTVEWVLGGRYLHSKHTGTVMNMPFEGIGMDGYDNGKKQYFSTWYDNMGTGVMLLTGQPTADGKGVNYSGTTFDPMQGTDVQVREETRMLDSSHWTMTMYMVMPGASGTPQEMKVMELAAEKM